MVPGFVGCCLRQGLTVQSRQELSLLCSKGSLQTPVIFCGMLPAQPRRAGYKREQGRGTHMMAGIEKVHCMQW